MRKTLRKGFTLIELLIVIVIIGVLAVTVLSAINPIEQIKKAQDAGKRSDSAELLNALERYYTGFIDYPWERGSLTPPAYVGSVANPIYYTGTLPDWLVDPTYGLIGVDELKDEFSGRDNLAYLYVFWDAATSDDTDLVRVCYPPESEANQTQADYTVSGEKVASSGTGAVFLCVPE